MAESASVVFFVLLVVSKGGGASLSRQSLADFPNAVCTDGSPAAYYHTDSHAHFDNYVIYLDGGGYCPSIEDCHLRCSIARTLCTESQSPTTGNHGILSDDPDDNPYMHDYYKVELPYCTGDMFVGQRLASWETDNLNFAGKFVFDAMISSLMEFTGIMRAHNIVLSGSSAGGAGAAFLCQHLKQMLPDVEVWCIVDAAFFYPMTKPFHNDSTCESIDKVLQNGAELWAAPEVGRFRLQDWWNDLHPQSRVFLGIAKFDVFGFESFCGDFDHGDEIEAWGKGMTPMMIRLLRERPDIGLFSGGCRYHMILHSDALFNRFRAGQRRITYAEAVENWMKGGSAASYQIWDICPHKNFCNAECNADGIPQQDIIDRQANV